MNNLNILTLYKLLNELSCVSSQSNSSCRACRAVLFDKLDTGKMRVESCRVEMWRSDEPNGIWAYMESSSSVVSTLVDLDLSWVVWLQQQNTDWLCDWFKFVFCQLHRTRRTRVSRWSSSRAWFRVAWQSLTVDWKSETDWSRSTQSTCSTRRWTKLFTRWRELHAAWWPWECWSRSGLVKAAPTTTR